MTTRRKGSQPIADTAGRKEKEVPLWKAFLQAYLQLGNMTKACAASGISHARVRTAILKNPEFRDALEDARALVADRLEDALRDRAIEGVDRLKFDKNGNPCIDPRVLSDDGKPVPYVEKEFSDHAAIFLLKGLRPEKYRERYEYTGKDGGPLETKITNLADLVKLAASARQPAEAKPEPKK